MIAWVLCILLLPPDLEPLLRDAPSADDLPGVPAVYLRREREVEADADGRRRVTMTGTLLILDDQGRSYDEVDLATTGAYQRVTVDRARLVRPGGELLDLGAAGLRSRRLGLYGLQGGDLLGWSLRFPYVEPGAVLDWRVTIRDTEPSLPEGFADQYALQTALPVRRATYTVRVPAEARLVEVASPSLGAALVARRGELDEYRWSASDLPPLTAEANDPLREPPGVSVLVSATSWEAIAGHYRSLTAARTVPHRALSEAVRRETAGAADPVAALYRYVATQIRYSEGPFERSVPGIEPRPAHRTFDLRFGDCKDQTTLLITMLREAGVTALPVLLRRVTSGPLQDSAPALQQFDHVVTAVPEGDGWRLLDPTWSHGDGGYPPPDIQGARALVLSEPARWIEVPVAAPEANRHERRAELTVGADGGLSGEVEISATGVYARSLRLQFRGLDAAAAGRVIAEGLSSAWMNVSLKTTVLDQTPADELSTLYRLRYEFSAAGLAEATERFVILRPAVFEQTVLPDGLEGERRRPFRLAAAPARMVNLVNYHLAPTLSLADLPPDAARREPWGEFAVRCRADGETLRYERTVTIAAPVVAAEQVPALREWYAELAAADRRLAVLTRGDGR